jgi:hypothetical protein
MKIFFSEYENGGKTTLTWTDLLAPESFAVEQSASLHLVSSSQSNTE